MTTWHTMLRAKHCTCLWSTQPRRGTVLGRDRIVREEGLSLDESSSRIAAMKAAPDQLLGSRFLKCASGPTVGNTILYASSKRCKIIALVRCRSWHSMRAKDWLLTRDGSMSDDFVAQALRVLSSCTRLTILVGQRSPRSKTSIVMKVDHSFQVKIVNGLGSPIVYVNCRRTISDRMCRGKEPAQ